MSKKSKCQKPASVPTPPPELELSAHHKLPDSVPQPLTPEEAAAQVRPIMDEVRASYEEYRKADRHATEKGLINGQKLMKLEAACVRVRVVSFGACLKEIGIPTATAYRHLRAAQGVAVVRKEYPETDPDDLSLDALRCAKLTGRLPLEGLSKCPTPQLTDPDAEPVFLKMAQHVDARWSQPHHTDALVEYVKMPGRRFWDACVGGGAIADRLRHHGFEVVGSDIIDYGWPGTVAWDMRTAKRPPFQFDVIVANVPWRSHDGWGPRRLLTHLCQWKPQMIAFLVPVTMNGQLCLSRIHPGFQFHHEIIFSRAKSKGVNPHDGSEVAEAWEMCWLVFVPGDNHPTWMTYVA